MSTRAFADRREAGRALARRLVELQLPSPRVVLALPRGGVPVAAEVARALHAPLDLLLVRKIGMPWQPELALAAVVEGDPPDLVYDEPLHHQVEVDRGYVEAQLQRQLQEIARQRRVYLSGRSPVTVQGHTVILVDDGIATGTTVRAALKALRRRQPARLLAIAPGHRWVHRVIAVAHGLGSLQGTAGQQQQAEQVLAHAATLAVNR